MASAYDTMLAGDVCSEHFFPQDMLPYMESRPIKHVILWSCCLVSSGAHSALSYVVCYLIGHGHWALSYGACCLMGHIISWGMLSYGACCHMGYVIIWGMLSWVHIIWGHDVLRGILSYGEYCLLGMLSQDACCQWGILSTGILFGAFHLVHHIKAMS